MPISKFRLMINIKGLPEPLFADERKQSRKRMSIERDKTSLLETAERVYRYMIAEHSGSSNLLNEFDVDTVAWGMNINDWEWNPGVGVTALATFVKVGPQRASGVRVVSLRVGCSIDPRKATYVWSGT